MNGQKLMIALFAIACCVSSARAQIDSVTQERMKKHQNSMANQQVMARLVSILQNKALQEELEIPDYQLEDLKKCAMEFQREFAKFNADNQMKMLDLQTRMQTGDDRAMPELLEIVSAMHEVSDQAMGAVEDILLPHQVKRIRQIARQETLKFQSGFGDEFGVALALSQELDLTPSQAKKLRESIVEARKEYYEKLAKLKSETHKKILDSLPAEKREKIKELLGERYDGDLERRKMFEQNMKKGQGD